MITEHDIGQVALPHTPSTIIMKVKQCLHSLEDHPLMKTKLWLRHNNSCIITKHITISTIFTTGTQKHV